MNTIGMMLASGEAVIDRFNSHVHGEMTQLLPAVFSRVKSEGRKFLIEEVKFDRIVGETVCVPTTDADEIVWAKRSKRLGHSRAFWESRALIWGSEETIPGTETTVCPW